MIRKLAICFLALMISAAAMPAGAALARGEDQGKTTANQEFGWGCWNRGDFQMRQFCILIRGHGSGYR